MIRPPTGSATKLPLAGTLLAFVLTLAVHLAAGYAFTVVEADMMTFRRLEGPFTTQKAAPAHRRGRHGFAGYGRRKIEYQGPRFRHGPVAFERRRLELECTSIPECEPDLEAQVIELKIARLGGAEPDPTELPEIQKYEEPELHEETVNVEEEQNQARLQTREAFLRRKAQLDRRRRRQKRVKNLFNLDDDPRARATAFERIAGRMDGDIYGRGADQEKFDSYFGRLAYELHKEFKPPTTLSIRAIRRQRVVVKITQINTDGTLVRYRILRRARKRGFTMAAEAALRAFMPTEGGLKRLPRPDSDILDFINRRGIIIDLDGAQFQL